MAESKKYAALKALRQPAEPDAPAVLRPLLPPKPPKPLGKRSDPAWGAHTVLLKNATFDQASKKLRDRDDGNDFSDLMQALLDGWLHASE